MWPTPSSPTSFWARPALAGLSRSVCRNARPAGTTPRKSAPPRKPLKSSTPRYGPISQGCGWGLALRPNVWFEAALLKKPDEGINLLYLDGCLDQFFKDLRAGKTTVRLLLDHDKHTELCSTRDSLRVWQDKDGAVRFRVDPNTARGRNAIRVARDRGSFRQASIGATFRRDVTDDDIPDVMVVTEAWIDEISLVQAGAFPGAKVWVE